MLCSTEDITMTKAELKKHVLDDLIDYIGTANCLDCLDSLPESVEADYNSIAKELIELLSKLKSCD